MAFATSGGAATVPPLFVDQDVAGGAVFDTPTAIAYLPGGRLLVTEKRGRVYTVTNGVKSATPMWSRENEVLDDGDRGLLGIAVDPNYVTNHYVYLLYSVDPDSDGVDTSPPHNFGRLTRYQVSFVDSTRIDTTSRTILMGVTWHEGALDAYSSHAIGSLRFGRDGSLLFSVGDGASYDYVDAGGQSPEDFGPGPDQSDPYADIGAFRSQSVSIMNGKIMRINPANGAGYPSNPYYDGNPSSVRSRVWAYGLRNPFRFCIRPGTGATDPSLGMPGIVYIGDVGWDMWEEMDVVRTPGMNFGWPCYEGMGPRAGYQTATPSHNDCSSFGTPDNPASPSPPTATWHHSDPSIGVPPGITGNCSIGGVFYSGNSFPAQYRGAYFFADYINGWIDVATVDGNDQLLGVNSFATLVDGPVDFAVDPQTGDVIYVAINTGQVRRIHFTGTSGNAPPVLVASATPTYGAPPLTVSFSSSGTFDPDGDPFSLTWQFGDGPSSSQPNPTHTYTAAGTYAAVLAADDGKGGISHDTLYIVVATTTAFPSTPVLDDFNRADGAIGGSWIDQPDGLTVSANALASNGAQAVTEWGAATFGPNQEAYLTITATDPGATEQDLTLKVQGSVWSAGEIEVWYSAPASSVYVYTYDAGEGWVQRGAFSPVTFAPGERLGARALANGMVQVFHDVTLLGTISVQAWPFASAGGRIGMSFTGAAAGRWDDFGGGDANLGESATPVVTVTSPNGGEAWLGGTQHSITWTASDDVGVTGVDVFYRDAPASPWTPLSLGQANTGSFTWFVHNTPGNAASVRVVAHDASGNAGVDESNGTFTIVATPGGRLATTLRDFFQPGTQPLGAGTFQTHLPCFNCHGGYAPDVEPGRNFRGTMMAQAARDPLFYACLAVAEQDAPSSGDLCIRCHAPMDWLTGLSQPTSGARIDALGRDGVSCDFCHRMVDPIYRPGVSPPEDQAVLAAMLPAHRPTGRSNGQYVVDADARRRGPFSDPVTQHTFLASPFHTSSDLCATCHDVSNPVFTRLSGSTYQLGPLDTPADSITTGHLMPLERTFSEWQNSAFPSGVFAPQFAGNIPSGRVRSCQDCHVRDVTGKGCNAPAAPTRTDLPLHDMMGGNAWAGGVIASLYPTETDAAALAAGASRAVSMLQKAAAVDVYLAPESGGYRASVIVTNHTGHKLPTGYPEGRRMWINLVARNGAGATVYQSGAYDPATGVLTEDAAARVYEAKLGVSSRIKNAVGLGLGSSFHFAINDTLFKDNRIPPAGFTNAAFDAFGGAPVEPAVASPRYPDGQYWDVATYHVPATTNSVTATLYYQTTSKEYIEFLRNENTTNTAGQALYDAWTGNGRASPVVMARDSVNLQAVDVPEPQLPRVLALRPLENPFRDRLRAQLALPRAANVRVEILDVTGRIVRRTPSARMAAGEQQLEWDGRGTDGRPVRSGAYWLCVWVDDRRLIRHVIALR